MSDPAAQPRRFDRCDVVRRRGQGGVMIVTACRELLTDGLVCRPTSCATGVAMSLVSVPTHTLSLVAAAPKTDAIKRGEKP